MQHSPFARIKKPLKSDMNVVPYIDVMLVLLVIFMITAPMITTGLKVDLPNSKADPLSSTGQEVAIVSVKANGEYYLRLGNGNDVSLPLTSIQEVLADEQTNLLGLNSGLMVLVNGDKTIPYGDVVQVMSSLQEAGILQVGLLTESTPANTPNTP